MCKTMGLTNAVVCNSSPLVIASGDRRQMRVTTLLFLVMSPGRHRIWMSRCNIPPKRTMCGRRLP